MTSARLPAYTALPSSAMRVIHRTIVKFRLSDSAEKVALLSDQLENDWRAVDVVGASSNGKVIKDRLDKQIESTQAEILKQHALQARLNADLRRLSAA